MSGKGSRQRPFDPVKFNTEFERIFSKQKEDTTMIYSVTVTHPQVIETLRAKFEKVGHPRAMHDTVLVTTDQPGSAIEAVAGVVKAVEDFPVDLEEAVQQDDPPQWALPWISDTGGSYENLHDGEGVDIYILDTGVRDTHEDLIGRVETLYSHDGVPYVTEGWPSPIHGTAVAACAAGTHHGTAKKATVVNCRTDFTFADIVKALDTILAHHLTKPADRQSVLNFSGSSPLSALSEVFQKVASYGIVCVAAAGNYGEDKPRHPAAGWFITGVGSIGHFGEPSSFTNRGVPVYAPGYQITTAGVASDTATTVISGTSFSSPYYAGLLACQLQGCSKFNTRSLADAFAFWTITANCQSDRVPQFPNSGTVRTVTTRVPFNGSEPWYTAPSLRYTDEEINAFCRANEHQPQVIAQEAELHNVDLARFSEATGYEPEEINEYFLAMQVTPWWFVDGRPVRTQ